MYHEHSSECFIIESFTFVTRHYSLGLKYYLCDKTLLSCTLSSGGGEGKTPLLPTPQGIMPAEEGCWVVS